MAIIIVKVTDSPEDITRRVEGAVSGDYIQFRKGDFGDLCFDELNIAKGVRVSKVSAVFADPVKEGEEEEEEVVKEEEEEEEEEGEEEEEEEEGIGAGEGTGNPGTADE